MAAKKGEKIKYRLAQAIGTCMQTTPVEAITVKPVSYTHLTLPTILLV